MGLLDQSFSLPGVSTLTSTVSQAAQSSISFAVADGVTKISETVGATLNTFGSVGNFTKLGANLPSFDTLAAEAMKAGSILMGGTGALVNSQITSLQNTLGGQGSASAVNAAATTVNTQSVDHLVSLTDPSGDTVAFKVMPEIVEGRTVEYEAVAPVQFPGAFQKYKGTSSVQWQLSVTFIARNSDEATSNLKDLSILRGWTMPFFGENTGIKFPGKLGAPPPTLILKGFRGKLVGPVPVVITSLNWNWPKDVDYLPTNEFVNGNAIPFPAVMTISIQLVESFSTTQFNQFNLADYRNGDMDAAFNWPISSAPLVPEQDTVTNDPEHMGS